MALNWRGDKEGGIGEFDFVDDFVVGEGWKQLEN